MFVSSTLFIPEEKNSDSKRFLKEPSLNASIKLSGNINTLRGEINKDSNKKHMKN
jgi:hypothetical protein